MKFSIPQFNPSKYSRFSSNFNKAETFLNLRETAFSHGQVVSKLWLCDQLEKTCRQQNFAPEKIYIYGGWYGLLPLFLRVHNLFRSTQFISFDVDEEANSLARKINDAFIHGTTMFETSSKNINDLSQEKVVADIVINTSCEHILEKTWFENLPNGQFCVLQSNDMIHTEHVNNDSSLEEFLAKYPIKNVLYSGEKKFQYENLRFSRFMVLGYK